MMELLVARFQPVENLEGLIDGRLHHIDFLESSRQGA